MALFDITKYREMFLDEAVELFETIDTLLLEAEDTGEMDEESINSLFRLVHTIKGNSASVELPMLAELTHEIEFFMDRLRQGELKFVQGMADLLIDAVDAMKEILELEMGDCLEREFFHEKKEEILKKIEAVSKDAELSLNKETIYCEIDELEGIEIIDELEDIEIIDDLSKDTPTHSYSFGLLPLDDDSGSFGMFDESKELHYEITKTNDETKEDDAFGLFDDDEEYFGLFDDFDIEDIAYPNTQDEESFGFFDDNELVEMLDDEEYFGLFDKPKEQAQKHVDINEQNEAFGLFDEEKVDTKNESSLNETQKTEAKKDEEPNVALKRQEEEKKPKIDSSSNSIRVDLSKIDGLMNNIGELVIAHSMLSQYIYLMEDQKAKADLSERLNLIDRHIRELQESVMSVRMIPMGTVFSKFPKVIRDTAKKLDKKIDFKYFGESVEIDKAMIEGLTDPLMHIVRNALDHGIESSQKRKQSGKSETGTLRMSAEQANGQMIIKIQDDGGGINIERVTQKAIQNGIIDEHQASTMSKDEKAMLIFAPGLSTAQEVTDISGRGVGMDVVMSNIKKLGGIVEVETEEKFGTTFSIALPLTLAILDGLNIRIGKELFILPLSAIIESLKPQEVMIQHIGDKNSEILMLRSEFIPIIRLHKFFGIEPQYNKLSDGLLIVVRSAGQKIALFIDEFMNQQQFVIKPLDKNFRTARGVGGATVRGDGTIGLIIDTMNIMEKNY